MDHRAISTSGTCFITSATQIKQKFSLRFMYCYYRVFVSSLQACLSLESVFEFDSTAALNVVVSMRTSCPPGAASPFALHHDHKDSPECVWAPVGSLKFNEQRKLPEDWKIPLSQGHSYQLKPDGAPSWLHYLCEIAFSPRKPEDFPHLLGP